ncbi:hypothetical protein PG996_012761 [Apiospora saccharicola]|uniref:Uncharacterized protein n=1 Tax=Apiospora saccharicola TaxID=335842 RepID=A0ABR1U3I5_9PEZI
MFGGLVDLITPATLGPPPKDVPPATPINLPAFSPQLADGSALGQGSVVRVLQSVQRPSQLDHSPFTALGVHVHTDVGAESLLPDPSYVPSGTGWDGMDVDRARAIDATFRKPLSNGTLSPEARVYLERRNELSIDNQAAFRTIKRIRSGPGSKAVRLGNCYEFFRQLDLMASYWDDTSQPPIQYNEDEHSQASSKSHPIALDGSLEQAEFAIAGATATQEDSKSQRTTYRTAPGSSMPPELRHGLITAFVKLVSYDCGCNLTTPRVEPRLHLLEPSSALPKSGARFARASYFPSGCNFLARVPQGREDARRGVVEGPIAAVSARNITNFGTPSDQSIDFGRELVAALITAQHRAREGQKEKRFGDGRWWATTRRWGGAEGGPIGRELESIERSESSSNNAPRKTENTATSPYSPTMENTGNGSVQTQGKEGNTNKRSQSPPHPISPSSGLPMRGTPANKKSRKTLGIYDNYRMVRLPSSNWDKKMRYTAIGKQPGADFDDVFVISSLFHHISILRVRVPMQLLEVFAGAPEENIRSWNKLEVWRSPWYDLFKPQERMEAFRLLWGLNVWLMRKADDGDGGSAKQDVVMKGDKGHHNK